MRNFYLFHILKYCSSLFANKLLSSSHKKGTKSKKNWNLNATKAFVSSQMDFPMRDYTTSCLTVSVPPAVLENTLPDKI